MFDVTCIVCRFLYQLSEIPHFSERLNCLLFICSFADSASAMTHKFITLQNACKSLRQCKAVSCLFNSLLCCTLLQLFLCIASWCSRCDLGFGQHHEHWQQGQRSGWWVPIGCVVPPDGRQVITVSASSNNTITVHCILLHQVQGTNHLISQMSSPIMMSI